MNFEEFSQESDVHSLIRSFKNSSELEDVVENVKKGVDIVMLYSIDNGEDLFKYIMPSILHALEEIYSKNIIRIQSGANGVLEDIKKKLRVAIMLTNCSEKIVDYIIKHETISFALVPSVPVNMAQILLLTFEHCKNSQKTYQSSFKSINEILDLFRKTQEVHTKFLSLLDTHLLFDVFDEKEMIMFKNLLDVILKISEMLSGVNMKSMADNWKGFITLIQKYSKNSTNTDYLSSAVKIITREIDSNMQTIFEMESNDSKKVLQTLKINGFLIKVVLKLYETELNIAQNFRDIISFCVVIYSWHPGIFQTNDFPEELVGAVNNFFYLNTESFVHQLFTDDEFLKSFCALNEYDLVLQSTAFGFLNFSNEFLKNIPKILVESPNSLEKCKIISLLHLIFSCVNKCYKEFFYDYNSLFYEELIVNVSTTILLFPDSYLHVERLLLKSVIQENIWTAMVAVDVWCIVLKYSSVTVCRSTLNNLIDKIRELHCGVFTNAPVEIRLKILTQRVLKELPNNILNETISVYNPSHNRSVWKILSFQDIPLSQRFYIEFILNEIYDKVNELEKENCTIREILLLVECIDIISYTSFTDLEINTARLVLLVSRLWSFNVSEIPSSNNFSKYFIHKLLRLTIVLSKEIAAEHLILVFSQLRHLLNDTIFKLLACDIIQEISKRDFNSFSEKQTLFSLTTDIFQTLLTDQNPIIIQVALETFGDISKNGAYSTVINKIAAQSDNKKLITNFMTKRANLKKYKVQCFEKMYGSTFQHQCLEWTDPDLPQNKKLKIDNNIDEVISDLKSNTQDLTRMVSRSCLNAKQTTELKNVINKLENLLM